MNSMSLKPISIYIHIPFCIKKCNYCDFASFPIAEGSIYNSKIKEYIQALKKEISNFPGDQYLVKSIFIGGGTPSAIEPEYIEEIDKVIKLVFPNINERLEYTIEVNPATVVRKKLTMYKEIGINRLSMGLQATDNKLLKGLGRLHSYEEFLDNYISARECGFTNINIDLMSGIPDLTLDDWIDTLYKIIELAPEHISAYSLILEEKTPLYEKNINGELNFADEEEEREMYYITKTILEQANYHRYEISNYAKQGFESYHNKTYWKLKEYIGFGLAAASYLNGKRTKNTTDFNKYRLNEKIVEEEIVQSLEDDIEEYMFLGLRMMEGINKHDFMNKFNQSVEDIYKEVIDYFVELNLLEDTKDSLRLTPNGIDVSNQIFEKFILS